MNKDTLAEVELQQHFNVAALCDEIENVKGISISGRVTEVRGPVIKALLSGVGIGDFVQVGKSERSAFADRNLLAQVVGFSNEHCVLSPLGTTSGIQPGARVQVLGQSNSISLSTDLLGCVLGGSGEMLTRMAAKSPAVIGAAYRSTLEWPAPLPLERSLISKPLITGIRAIDAFVPLGCGQRICVIAEPGVGKSTLLARIASQAAVDVNVIALIGERGREIKEFIYDALSPEVRERSVIVASTSDDAAMLRVNAALTATRVAEYFRDLGCNVLLQLDSLTRLLRAHREVGLSAGEIPVRQGYPPSVFSFLPRIIERTGTNAKGSITALYTVLSSGSLDEDPMIDEIKGLTDGHILLSKTLAERGHFPAIDVLGSISRLQDKVQAPAEKAAAARIRRLLSRLKNDKDFALLGAEVDDELRLAMSLEESIDKFLRQEAGEISSVAQTAVGLRRILGG